MGILDEKKLTKWVVILPILSVIITALVFVISGIQNKKTNLKNEIKRKQVVLLKKHKRETIHKIDNIASFLQNIKALQISESKNDVKNMVDLAHSIIDHIYKDHKELTKIQMLNRLKNILRDIRFWDNTGYFFVYDTSGKCILLPTQPSLENTNLINLQDAKEKFTIKEHIKIVKEKEEGFSNWFWYKKDEEVMKKKIGFVKMFKPLDIYLGTAKYEEDIINSIKSKMVKQLKGDSSIFFIYDNKSKKIIKNSKQFDEELVSNILIGSKMIPEGYFINNTVGVDFDVFNEVREGTLFVRKLEDFGWTIGVNTYNEKTLTELEKEQKKLEKSFIEIIKNRTFFALIIILGISLITVVFSNKLKKVLRRYQKNLIEQHKVTLKQQERLTHNLKHDYLTSLPNRILLTDRLEQGIKHSYRSKKQIAVMFVDIDKFKSINDSLGHNVGDELLKKVAIRLKKSIRDSDTVARFGGDEFVLVIDDVKNIHDITKVIEKIQSSLENKITIAKTNHTITLSIGISVFPNDGKSVKNLLKNADIAMYKAKNEGGNGYRFFTSTMNEEIQHQIELEKALRTAIENKEFVLHYQPIVETKSKRIIGVEALIRWNHPTKGLIYPDEFIGIAEQSSVIIDMGRWIVDEAMRQMSQWKEKGYELKKMSINIAIKQLEDNNFISCMKNELKKTNCKAEWIEIEIIERFAMKDIKKSIEILNEIRKMNIDIAIDDFGTGHSSLAYLKQLPITKLKIDRAFVNNIINSYEDKAIAESILALGSGLHLNILAEGIETQEQKEFFSYGNCQQMQGYLFSKPLCLEKIEKLLQKGYFE